MNDPAQRLGLAELVARVDVAHPDLDEVPAELVQRLNVLQPNWRRIIELLREDMALVDVDAGPDVDARLRDLETRLAAVERHLADVAYSVGVPKPKVPKPTS